MPLAALLLASATWLQCPGPADDQLLRLRLDGRLQRAEVVQITPLGRRSRQSPIKASATTLEIAGFDRERLRIDRGQLLLAAGDRCGVASPLCRGDAARSPASNRRPPARDRPRADQPGGQARVLRATSTSTNSSRTPRGQAIRCRNNEVARGMAMSSSSTPSTAGGMARQTGTPTMAGLGGCAARRWA